MTALLTIKTCVREDSGAIMLNLKSHCGSAFDNPYLNFVASETDVSASSCRCQERSCHHHLELPSPGWMLRSTRLSHRKKEEGQQSLCPSHQGASPRASRTAEGGGFFQFQHFLSLAGARPGRCAVRIHTTDVS